MPSEDLGVSPEIRIPLYDQVAFKKRKLRVITIGAGFSGLILAHKIQHQEPDCQEFIEHVILEANDDVGGTWKAFPFDPNPNWSKFYADGDEILEYVNKICDKWDLRRDIRFNHRVIALDWLEDDSKWKVKIRVNGQEEIEELADVVVSAQGFLSQWKWPNIPGIHDFKGHKVHSAAWDHSYDYSNKRIGIIGNGSSGIQILPQLAKLPGTSIVSFQRGPTWITQSLGEVLGAGQTTEEKPETPAQQHQQDAVNGDSGAGDTGDEDAESSFNPRYSAQDKQRFRDEPEKHKAYRKMLQHGMNKGFSIFKKDSDQNRTSTAATVARMRAALNNDPELCAKLIPTWTLGCRRLTPGASYLESFLRPNVSLDTSALTHLSATSAHTATQTHDLDVLVCATGFDVSHIPHYPVTGRGGVTLAAQWTPEPIAYLSVACPNMPNFFTFTGPNATVGHGTLLTSLTWTAGYIVRWLRKMAREDVASVAPRADATAQFAAYGDAVQQTLAWTGGCRSWYKNHRVDGRVTATWPGSALLYREIITGELRGEDFDIRWRSANRWRFMGRGVTELEETEGADLAFYVER